MKCEDLTKAQPVAQPEGDLATGIVKATEEAIQSKVSEVSGKEEAINSLTALNNLANGNLGEKDSGLAAGWGGSMLESLKSRKDQLDKGGYSPEELAQADPEAVNKEAAAKTMQMMIHGALNKSE
jgi:hypothetical protein